jgi:hypothetical protein
MQPGRHYHTIPFPVKFLNNTVLHTFTKQTLVAGYEKNTVGFYSFAVLLPNVRAGTGNMHSGS